MPDLHHEKMQTLIKRLSAGFIETVSNQTSLITVSGTRLSDDLKKATVLITVLPEDKEAVVIDFLKRQLGDLRKYVRENSKIGMIPFLDIEIDEGEKNRQKIDSLLLKK